MLTEPLEKQFPEATKEEVRKAADRAEMIIGCSSDGHIRNRSAQEMGMATSILAGMLVDRLGVRWVSQSFPEDQRWVRIEQHRAAVQQAFLEGYGVQGQQGDGMAMAAWDDSRARVDLGGQHG